MKIRIKTLSLVLIGIIFIYSTSLSEEDTFSKANALHDNYFKRNNPKYDYVICNDRLPHFRVAFLVPAEATSFIPKRFIIIYGFDFWKYVWVKYELNTKKLKHNHKKSPSIN